MGKKRKEDFDNLEFDDDEVIDDNEQQHDDASTSINIPFDKETRKAIISLINEETSDIRQQQKKMAKQIKILDTNQSAQAELLEKLEKNSKGMLKALSRIDNKAVVTTEDVIDAVESDNTEEKKRGVIGTTLGAVGSVAHGIVDTCAFVLESTIDLVTLGNARK